MRIKLPSFFPGFRFVFLLFFVFIFLLLALSFSSPSTLTSAKECNEGDPTLQQICLDLNKLNESLQMSLSATAPLESELAKLDSQIKSIQKKIDAANAEAKNLAKTIEEREIALEYQKEILAARVRSYYKKSSQYSPLLLFLTSNTANDLFRDLSYRQTATGEDKKIIVSVSQSISQLKEDKIVLERNKVSLASLQKKIDQQAEFFRTEVAKAKTYQKQLSSQIAELTAKQQALLSARSGTFTTSVGDVPISTIPCSGPPGSPSYCDPGGGNWFAAFSFGAWTHRKGMSQYGAKGRADAGQSAETILQAYYGRGPIDKDTSGTISVSGYGNLNFEEYYLYGIAEMPSSWNMEALRAQAIAARSYAFAYKSSGKTICTTQACQVFSNSKAANPPDAWRQAVNATRGKIVEGVTAFYSSTSGGYLTTSGWDTTDGQGGSGFASRAWESKAGSPWFYSSWYTQSYLASSPNCGRGHPWLNEEEVADLLNAWLVLQKQGSDDRILPTTINQCTIGRAGGNPYSKSELRDKAESLGGAFTSVSAVSVSYSNDGFTSSLNFSTNKGQVSLSGAEFKQAFNLRAPGYIAIRSPLFNFEKK